MGLEESGIKLVVDGLNDFKSGLDEAKGRLDDLKDSEDSAGESSNWLSDALVGLGDVALTGLKVAAATAAAGVAALGAVLVEGIGGALETEQTMARLEAQLKATGGAAGLTMDDLTALGAQFQDLAGGTDDPIYAIESIGLKFSNITKDVMPDFIQASLDMAAVMGTDATSAAQMLGMALEDPVGSMGRLKRAGIIFTDAEKDQIKAMTAAGDAAGAQQMILDKLAATTGGAAAAQAETLAGKWEIFKGRLGEAAETIGMSLLPVLTNFFDNTIAPAIPVIEGLATAFGYFFEDMTAGSPAVEVFGEALVNAFGPETGGQMTDFIANLFDGISGVVNFVIANLPMMQETFSVVFGAVQEVGTALTTLFQEHIAPALAAVFGTVTGEGPSAQEVFTAVMTTIQTVAGGVADFITSTIIPVLGQVFDWLAVNLPPAIQTLSDFWTGTLQPALAAVWNFVQTSVIPMLQTVWDWVATNLPPALQTLSDFWNTTLLPALTDVWNFANTYLVPLLDALANVVLAAVSKAVDGLALLWKTTLQPALEGVWKFINETLAPLFNAFIRDQLDKMSASLDAASGFVSGLIDWLKKLAEWISKIDWGALQPGSPTPFELGLRGATDAARALASQARGLADMSGTFGMGMSAGAASAGVGGALASMVVGTLTVGQLVVPALAGGRGSTTNTTNNSVNVNANYARWQEPPAIAEDITLAMALL